MFKFNFSKLSLSRRLCYSLLIVLTMLYPGQNSWQTKTIHKGPVLAYTLPSPSLAPYPVGDTTPLPPLTARAYLVQDEASRAILVEHNESAKLYPASTTKIMTALVALDHYQLDDVITITEGDKSIGQLIKFAQGKSYTVESLLYGLLISSGNDAAVTLANHYPGGYSAFITAMNAKARALHLDSTTYLNPTGIDEPGHLTTARDLAILASSAMQNEVISRMVALPTHTITDTIGTTTHYLVATNELVGHIEGLKGLKTGWTAGAGECLVTYVERDDHALVTVVLGSADRFGETRLLIDWAYTHHTWVDIDNH